MPPPSRQTAALFLSHSRASIKALLPPERIRHADGSLVFMCPPQDEINKTTVHRQNDCNNRKNTDCNCTVERSGNLVLDCKHQKDT